ncbi:MAG: aldehyde dehydrogenase family protein [Nevskiales bacterium]
MKRAQEIRNPYSGAKLGEYRFATNEEIAQVMLRLARGREMQRMLAPFERAEILLKLTELLRADADEFATLISEETGKVLRDSRVEVSRALNTLQCSAEEARRRHGELLNSDAFPPKRDRRGLVEWRPIGTVLAITPFNFPLNLVVHKIGPAFAAGNSIFFKPSPQAWLCARRFTELAHEAGMPEEVLQLCLPDVPELQRVIQQPLITCVNITGSVRAGKAIAAAAGPKKLLLELGGNDPLIVLPDADLDAAAATAVAQRFISAGQRCTAPKQLFVHQQVTARFSELLLEKTRALVIGDPLDEKTDVGPVIHEKAAEQVMNAIAATLDAGAQLLAGNRREGAVVWPTILDKVPEQSPVVREEIFGPVAPIREFREIADVVRQVNAQPFGLQAGVFTNDLAAVKRLFDELEVGALAVNDGPGFRAEHFPFGGVKDSGLGREGVAYAMREMSVRKTLVI